MSSFLDRRAEELDVYKARDPAARHWLEIVFCYPGLHAVWLHRLNHRLWNWNLCWLARFMSHLSRFFTGVEIHPAVVLGQRVFIDHGMGIVIGKTSEVGDDCSIYQGVTLGGTTQTFRGKRHPTLEAGVIVGAGAKVLGPITVGEGARVGSNAVVVKDVPAGATAVGVPARVIDAQADSAAEESAEEKPAPPSFAAYGEDGRCDCESSEYAALRARVEALEERLRERTTTTTKSLME